MNAHIKNDNISLCKEDPFYIRVKLLLLLMQLCNRLCRTLGLLLSLDDVFCEDVRQCT